MIYLLLDSGHTAPIKVNLRKPRPEDLVSHHDTIAKLRTGGFYEPEVFKSAQEGCTAAFNLFQHDLSEHTPLCPSFSVQFESDEKINISGKSAGAAFALAFIEKVAAQYLSFQNKHAIAATAKITTQGKLEKVTGISQKIQGLVAHFSKNPIEKICVILAEGNREDITETLFESIKTCHGELIFAEDLTEAIQHAFFAFGLLSPAPPIKGLQFYDVKDRPFFFGRHKVVQQISERALSHFHHNAEQMNNVFALIGGCGTGKSSLLRAGLMHDLIQHAYAQNTDAIWIEIDLSDQTISLIDQLILAINNTLRINFDPVSGVQLDTQLFMQSPDLAIERLISLYQIQTKPFRFYLLADQFEQIFSRKNSNKDEVAHFLNFLKKIIQDSSNRFGLLIGMRSEYISIAQSFDILYDWISPQGSGCSFFSTPATIEEYEIIIERTLRRMGLPIEASFVHHLAVDAANSDYGLALLQVTLETLHEKLKNKQASISLLYKNYQGISQALILRGNNFFENLANNERDQLEQVLHRLVGINPQNNELFARTCLIHESDTSTISLLRKMSDNNLVTQGAVEKGMQKFKLSHEVLLYKWPVIGKWIEHTKSLILIKCRFDQYYHNWSSHGKHNDYLIPYGSPLDEVKKLRHDHASTLLPHEIDFIQRSVKADRRRLLRNRLGKTFLVMMCVVSGYFGIIATQESDRAKKNLEAAFGFVDFLRTELSPLELKSAVSLRIQERLYEFYQNQIQDSHDNRFQVPYLESANDYASALSKNGQTKKAIEVLETAIAPYHPDSDYHNLTNELIFTLSQSFTDLGKLYTNSHTADDMLLLSVDHATRLYSSNPHNPGYIRNLSRVYSHLAEEKNIQKKHEESLASYRSSIKFAKLLLSAPISESEISDVTQSMTAWYKDVKDENIRLRVHNSRLEFALDIYRNFAFVAIDSNDIESASQAIEEATRFYNTILSEFTGPTPAALRYDIHTINFGKSRMYFMKEEHKLAYQTIVQSIEPIEALCKEDPNNQDYLKALAHFQDQAGMSALYSHGHDDIALNHFIEFLKSAKKLTKQEETSSNLELVTNANLRLFEFYFFKPNATPEDLQLSYQHLVDAEDANKKSQAHFGNHTSTLINKGLVTWYFGDYYLHTGLKEKAKKLYVICQETFFQLKELNPENIYFIQNHQSISEQLSSI